MTSGTRLSTLWGTQLCARCGLKACICLNDNYKTNMCRVALMVLEVT